ncbi:hypothetical protein GLYMA_13G140400v4 [Glycine max]|nr:hypothetical protein GLYMA_13G140400v4 [Glycine max]KAH1101452.1 hypothetical protein GYH30_036159 [Glycine max]
MAHQENQVTGKISEDLDDEKRLYECVRKYEIIVKQFDELMAIMSNGNAVAKTKWRKFHNRGHSGRVPECCY